MNCFDSMYEIAKNNGIVHTKEEFAKILKKPLIDHEIDVILKPIENKFKRDLKR